MRKKILIALLLQISQTSFCRSLIVAPDGPTATLYINGEVGTTVEFPGDIKLITPLKYYTTHKQGSKYLYIKAKNRALEEPVSIIISGGRKLFLSFLSSKNAHRLVTINLSGQDKKQSPQEKIVISAVTGKAIPGVVYQSMNGEPISINNQKLEPHGSYHLPPYIGMMFKKSDNSADFDHKKTSLGPLNLEVWSLDLGEYVMWVVENRQAFSIAQIMQTFNAKKSKEEK